MLWTTGGAVSLCSATTLIGYLTLLVADNRALCSFGALAGLGEVTCLLATLLVLPALLVRFGSRPGELVGSGPAVLPADPRPRAKAQAAPRDADPEEEP